jgi:hypothetical protein
MLIFCYFWHNQNLSFVRSVKSGTKNRWITIFGLTGRTVQINWCVKHVKILACWDSQWHQRKCYSWSIENYSGFVAWREASILFVLNLCWLFELGYKHVCRSVCVPLLGRLPWYKHVNEADPALVFCFSASDIYSNSTENTSSFEIRADLGSVGSRGCENMSGIFVVYWLQNSARYGQRKYYICVGHTVFSLQKFF